MQYTDLTHTVTGHQTLRLLEKIGYGVGPDSEGTADPQQPRATTLRNSPALPQVNIDSIIKIKTLAGGCARASLGQ